MPAGYKKDVAECGAGEREQTMATTKPCPACGKDVAADLFGAMSAHTCPHCGYVSVSRRIQKASRTVLVLIVLGVLFLWCVGGALLK